MKRPPLRVYEALVESGLPWSIENGSKHRKIFLSGCMVGILSHGNRKKDEEYAAIHNIVAQIRRAAKSLNSGSPVRKTR